MKKMILLLCTTTLFAACSSSTSEKSTSTPTGPGRGNEQAKDTTDYSVCGQGPRATSIEGVWKKDEALNEIQFLIKLDISKYGVTVSNTCTIRGRSLTAKVRSSSYYDSQKLVIANSDEKTENFDDNMGNTMNCSASVKASTSQYELRGSCLVFKDAQTKDEVIFVPAY